MSRLLVTQYQAEVEKIIRYGGSCQNYSWHRNYFSMLSHYCLDYKLDRLFVLDKYLINTKKRNL